MKNQTISNLTAALAFATLPALPAVAKDDGQSNPAAAESAMLYTVVADGAG